MTLDKMLHVIGPMPLLAAVAMLGCGGLVLWANPRRLVNRAASLWMLHMGIWFVTRGIAAGPYGGLWWFRLTVSFGAWSVLTHWFFKESVTTQKWIGVWRRSRTTFLSTVLLSVLPWTDFFVPRDSSPENPLYAPGYYLYMLGYGGILLANFLSALRYSRKIDGLARIELRVVGLGGGAVSLIVILRMFTSLLFPSLELGFVPFLLGLGVCAFAAWQCATHKIFEAQQLFRLAAGQLLLLTAVGLGLAATYAVFGGRVSHGSLLSRWAWSRWR